MKIVSSKKKVSLLQSRISDNIPYTILPPDVIDPPILCFNPNPREEVPFVPCRVLPQNETYGTTKRKELTLEEEVEEYLKKEAAKEKSSKPPKYPKPSAKSPLGPKEKGKKMNILCNCFT